MHIRELTNEELNFVSGGNRWRRIRDLAEAWGIYTIAEDIYDYFQANAPSGYAGYPSGPMSNHITTSQWNQMHAVYFNDPGN